MATGWRTRKSHERMKTRVRGLQFLYSSKSVEGAFQPTTNKRHIFGHLVKTFSQSLTGDAAGSCKDF